MTTFLLGVATGLALVQLYPPSARVGLYIATKLRDAFYFVASKYK